MANGKVAVNSEVVSSIVAHLDEAYTILDSDISNSLDNDFIFLKEMGLATNCLSKIKKQVEQIAEANKTIVDSIKSHLSDVEGSEQKLVNNFNRGYSSSGVYSYGSGSNSGQASGSEIQVDEEEDGKSVNVEGFTEILDSLDDNEKKNLLKLLSINKDEKTSLNDLLMNPEYSEDLFKLLKSVLGSVISFDDLTLDEMKEVQKILLDSILKGETEYEEFENESILMEKEYLVNICKEYKIDPSDLVFDDLYKNVLKTSIKNFYNGNVDQSISEERILNFRTYIDKVALENNMNSNELIANHIELLL